MVTATAQWGQLTTIVIMAIALGMDAFSLGIGLGMRGIRLLHIVYISMVIAIFHILMPLMGMFTGHYVSTILGGVAVATGGGLLVLLGCHMIYSAMSSGRTPYFDILTVWGALLFALSVSIDSFSVGISLGLFSSEIATTVILFGIFGGVMSVMGLLLGRRVGKWMGEYGEAFGGVILLIFGLKFLF
ncbi:MAG: manganese efflux pump [Paenibacillaceae bacterium]